jgi:hypothetical protein
MKRKQFLNLSGKSFLSLTFLSQLPAKSMAQLLENNKMSSGGAMIEVKTQRLFLQDTWTISRNSSDYKETLLSRSKRMALLVMARQHQMSGMVKITKKPLIGSIVSKGYLKIRICGIMLILKIKYLPVLPIKIVLVVLWILP